MKTVIVGGVAAGASTGARLRRLDESAEIVILERDHYVSFANCGLPYHIGGAIPDRDSLLLQTPESLARALALDVRTGQDVVGIDRDAKEVEVRDLAQGRTYRESYDKLVLCLGAEPVRPPIPGADDPRVDVLRNIPDTDRIITVVKVFDMTAGGTGMTETELRAAGVEYRMVYDHHNGHAAYYPGTAPLFLKVLFAPDDGRLLGGQVLGWDGVDKRVDVLAVALRAGMMVYDLEHLELAYAPPYGSAKDPLNMAGFLGANLLRGDIDLWYPEEYPDCADKVTILDTRTPAEYDAWHIPEAVLIPYTELRQRLDEVPRNMPVYTYCRSGFRSYIAYCVLKQNGFDDVAFLSGGMMTYHGYHRTSLTVGKGGMPMVSHAEDELAQYPGALQHV